MIERQEPVFEVLVGGPEGHAYRIWRNGEIEGFGDGALVINRIPELLHAARAEDLRVYDIANDTFHSVTGEDLRLYACLRAAFGSWRGGEEKLRQIVLEIAQGKRPPFDIARAIQDGAALASGEPEAK